MHIPKLAIVPLIAENTIRVILDPSEQVETLAALARAKQAATDNVDKICKEHLEILQHLFDSGFLGNKI
jgi:hypothetical protein